MLSAARVGLCWYFKKLPCLYQYIIYRKMRQTEFVWRHCVCVFVCVCETEDACSLSSRLFSHSDARQSRGPFLSCHLHYRDVDEQSDTNWECQHSLTLWHCWPSISATPAHVKGLLHGNGQFYVGYIYIYVIFYAQKEEEDDRKKQREKETKCVCVLWPAELHAIQVLRVHLVPMLHSHTAGTNRCSEIWGHWLHDWCLVVTLFACVCFCVFLLQMYSVLS